MQMLAREAMEEGAMGLGSALIYAPAFYASTDELVALSKAVAPYGGMYISHMRSEGARLLEAIDELITISRQAGLPAEIYHLKAAGQPNWNKLEPAIAKIEQARASGLHITANMYNYLAAARKKPGEFLFGGRRGRDRPITTRQYARLVGQWIAGIGLDPRFFGTHSLRRTKATLIYRRTGNLRAVQLLLGHKKIESTVRYLGIEVDDALAIAEQVDV